MKTIIGVGLALLLLAGCAQRGAVSPLVPAGSPAVTSPTSVTPEKVKALVSKVQAYTRTACQFEPIFASVVGLINAGAGAITSVLGDSICNAVTTNPLAEGDKPGYYKTASVNGVPIQGRFVK